MWTRPSHAVRASPDWTIAATLARIVVTSMFLNQRAIIRYESSMGVKR